MCLTSRLFAREPAGALIRPSWIEESYEITLRNHKTEAIEVRVVEHMFRWSAWKVTESSQDYEKQDAQTIEFRVQVPASGEATVTYTVKYEW